MGLREAADVMLAGTGSSAAAAHAGEIGRSGYPIDVELAGELDALGVEAAPADARSVWTRSLANVAARMAIRVVEGDAYAYAGEGHSVRGGRLRMAAILVATGLIDRLTGSSADLGALDTRSSLGALYSHVEARAQARIDADPCLAIERPHGSLRRFDLRRFLVGAFETDNLQDWVSALSAPLGADSPPWDEVPLGLHRLTGEIFPILDAAWAVHAVGLDIDELDADAAAQAADDRAALAAFELPAPAHASHSKLDTFLARASGTYPDRIRSTLTDIQNRASVRDELGADLEAERAELAVVAEQLRAGAPVGSLCHLALALRDVQDFEGICNLYEGLRADLQDSVTFQEQYALALNRSGRSGEALAALDRLLVEPERVSAETFGIAGRIYKDRYLQASEPAARRDAIDRAIDAYQRGFDLDPADTFAGINLLTLLSVRDQNDPRLAELAPIVRYFADRDLMRTSPAPDYWVYATRFEFAVVAEEPDAAAARLDRLLEFVRLRSAQTWMLETTARNVGIVKSAFETNGIDTTWIGSLHARLLGKRSAA